MNYESTTQSVLVCMKDKQGLHQRQPSLQVQGSDASPPFSTCEPTAGVVSSFGLLRRRETLVQLSKPSTGHRAGGARGEAEGPGLGQPGEGG